MEERCDACGSNDGCPCDWREIAEARAAQRDEARGVAGRYFKWINDEESPEEEFAAAERAKYPWLCEEAR